MEEREAEEGMEEAGRHYEDWFEQERCPFLMKVFVGVV